LPPKFQFQQTLAVKENMAIRITLVDADGQTIETKSITNSADLRMLAEQARNLVRECDRLAQAKESADPSKKRVVPYT